MKKILTVLCTMLFLICHSVFADVIVTGRYGNPMISKVELNIPLVGGGTQKLTLTATNTPGQISVGGVLGQTQISGMLYLDGGAQAPLVCLPPLPKDKSSGELYFQIAYIPPPYMFASCAMSFSESE